MRENDLQFPSTTIEVLYAETFWSGYLLSEAIVSGGEIYLPLIIINYMLVWMERKKLWMEIDIPVLGSLGYCAVGDVYYIYHVLIALNTLLWGIPMWRRDIFFYSLSDLLLPVNSCECVAQDFLSICKSKTFFYFLSFSRLFCLYSLFMKEWEWENGRWKNPLHSWS